MAGLKDQVSTKYTDYGSDPNFFDTAFKWEPKRQNEFYLSINNIPAYLIKTSDKPKIDNKEIALDHINIKRYVKGKSEWNTISITLYDPIVPSGAEAVMAWIRKHHESATGRDGYSNYYKQNIQLHQLSPLGEKVEEWELKGTFITSAEFGKYDWSAGESVQEISVTLRYDYAILNSFDPETDGPLEISAL
jgi:hypothetical protein